MATILEVKYSWHFNFVGKTPPTNTTKLKRHETLGVLQYHILTNIHHIVDIYMYTCMCYCTGALWELSYYNHRVSSDSRTHEQDIYMYYTC